MLNDQQDNISNISVNDKMDILDKVENNEFTYEQSLNILTILVRDEDNAIRYLVAEALAFFEPNDKIRELLIYLSMDKDYLIRANACDSMCILKDTDSINKLKQILKKDRSQLVRGYAALSIADINYNMDIKDYSLSMLIQEMLKKEKSEWAKINYYAALIKLGEKSYLQMLLNGLDDPSYRNRCATVNSVRSLIDDGLIENIESILELMEQKKLEESSEAVKSSMRDVLEEIAKKL